eukprot:3535005-Rhodomonas_salina.1
MGTFKGGNGSAACMDCDAGQYLDMTAGTVCSTCPSSSSSSPMRSDDVTDCVCNAGYTGPDGGTCEACGVGTAKAVNGSSACVDCEAG